jgi:hypothetical protein
MTRWSEPDAYLRTGKLSATVFSLHGDSVNKNLPKRFEIPEVWTTQHSPIAVSNPERALGRPSASDSLRGRASPRG